MAPSHETGNPIVTANNPFTDLLRAPLCPGWTVEKLAEQLLGVLAAQRSEESQEFVLDADDITDRQLRRLIRPLLARLATKSAAEAGTPPNLYGGHLAFRRPSPNGPVWILGQFENRPGKVRIALRRSSSPLTDAVAATETSPAANRKEVVVSDDRITQVPVPCSSELTSSERSEGIMDIDSGFPGMATADSGAITQAIKATGAIVQVGRDDFIKIVTRQHAALIVHATGRWGLFWKSYQYLTSYKGLTFFACLSAPLDLPSDVEIVLAKRIEVPY